MARSLGSYVDTGITIDLVWSATIEILMRPGTAIAPNVSAALGDWTIGDFSVSFGPPPITFPPIYSIWLSGHGVGLTEVYHNQLATNSPPYAAVWSPAFQWTERSGPYRLGMRYELIDPADPLPHFALDYIARYHWFGDEFTTRQSTLAGVAGTLGHLQADGSFNGPYRPNLAPVDVGSQLTNIAFGGTTYRGLASELQVKFRGLSATGIIIDTSGLNMGPGALVGLGGGDVNLNFTGTPGSYSATAQGAYHLTESAYVPRNGGADAGATILNADGDLNSSPYSATYEWCGNSWGAPTRAATRFFSIQAAWALSQDPVLPSDDRSLFVHLDPPRLTGSTNYLPVSVLLAPSVDVNRPDGLRPSDWVSSDTGKLAVTELGGESDFAVSATGAAVTRTFISDWRHRVGLFGTGDPLFGYAECERTRHRANEDIWGWSTYAFLRVEIESPSDTALILTVSGTHLTVSDSHETSGVSRAAAFSATATAWTKTYALTAREGTRTVDLDLLFPNEGPHPFYPDRVDSLKIEGFKTGTYRLKALKLIAKGPGYLKWAPGKQVQREDYSAWGLAVDGAYVYGDLPDQAVKPDETGQYGGNPRYITPLIGTGTGTILDTQYSLSALCGTLTLQEGMTASYSQAVFDAAMRDNFGTILDPELAQFMKPLLPYSGLTPGTAYLPDCAVLAGQVEIPSLLHFTNVGRLHIHGGLEALAVSLEGERVGDGIRVDAVRADTGAVVASGLTDRFGYVVTTPVPANGSRLYGLQGHEDPQPIEETVALRVRDLVRLPVKVNIAESGPWPLEERTQQYHRAHTKSGRVEYRRANHTVPPFDYGSSPTEGLQPRMCRDQRGRVRLFYTEQPLPVGNVLQRIGDDDGITFGEPSVVLPGGAFPSVTYDARTETVFAVMYGGGSLYGWRERPNVTAVPYAFAGISVEEDVAHACPAPGSPGCWLLACRVLNEGAISLWRSTDDGSTWQRYATGLPGHTHPHVMVDPLGIVLVAGYKDGHLSGALLYPGETMFRGQHTFTDGSAALQVADTTFGIAVAHENAQRWVLATRITGEQQCSEWFSADMGRSWSRVSQ
jgi:hypothetical protein